MLAPFWQSGERIRGTQHQVSEILAGSRMRQLRGLEIIARGDQIRPVSESSYRVRSQHGNGWYVVELTESKWVCDCPDFRKKGTSCKHAFAVIYLLRLPSIMLSNAVPLSTELAEKDRIRSDLAREGMIP